MNRLSRKKFQGGAVREECPIGEVFDGSSGQCLLASACVSRVELSPQGLRDFITELFFSGDGGKNLRSGLCSSAVSVH